jgi:hypothetical protein
MSPRLHGDWLEGYLAYTQHSESPAEVHFWTGVATIAGALRRRVWIDMRHFQWTPNFYITIVAPPGVIAKSTSINIGMRLLRKVKGVKFGPQVITWQALTQALAEAREGIPIGKDEFGMPNIHNMSCITCAIDELGTFLNPADKEMVDALTSLWDSKLGIWDKKTKTQGDDIIENPWINVIGCTTPSWMHTHFTEDLIGGGLASRTLFVYAEEKRQLVAYPSQAINGTDYEALAADLITDLTQIADMKGEFVLTSEAVAWGSEWYAKHHAGVPSHMTGERFGGYLARKQTHIHKTAMVLSASESDELIITVTHLQRADKRVTQLEKSMGRVFGKIGESSTSKHVSMMLDFLKAYGELEERRLWFNCMNQMTGREFKRAVADGVEAQVLGRRQDKAGKKWLKRKEAT